MHILKKGTLVKHGTISSLLPAIFDKGLQPRAHVHEYRSRSESSPYAGKGVYVGGVLAYNAAYLSFSDAAKQLERQQIDIKKGAVPIVLEIELAEDCQILADEDFVMLEEHARGGIGWEHKEEFERRMVEDAQKIWKEYQTAAIVREGGVPAGWIKRIEYPEVKNNPNDKISSDAAVFAFACLSHLNAMKESDALEVLSCNGYSPNLSHSASANKIIYKLNEFSSYKDERKRAGYILGFLRLVGSRLVELDVPQVFS